MASSHDTSHPRHAYRSNRPHPSPHQTLDQPARNNQNGTNASKNSTADTYTLLSSALIRYFLQHPRVPRPLRFSRLRALRHWTIHRAWQLFRSKQRRAQELELERQYNSMRDACEALRLLDEGGINTLVRPSMPSVSSASTASGKDGQGQREQQQQQQQLVLRGGRNEVGGGGREVGRLYRLAMLKEGIWGKAGRDGKIVGGVPIEYARPLVEYPSREGWNHGWRRGA
ncbi:hypothetical protein LTS18_005589 [Coniosporium uncinatum]|uniref:Uncharacterized protein n=1 Tax=Coniosporium uncinatum TaxID=93489 RepID=A0ACC3DQZ3_9PEZI|nr:hypothetical protein LTS18_005589 [Coniosporium uncinatum]